jgi:hypothetical protein
MSVWVDDSFLPAAFLDLCGDFWLNMPTDLSLMVMEELISEMEMLDDTELVSLTSETDTDTMDSLSLIFFVFNFFEPKAYISLIFEIYWEGISGEIESSDILLETFKVIFLIVADIISPW